MAAALHGFAIVMVLLVSTQLALLWRRRLRADATEGKRLMSERLFLRSAAFIKVSRCCRRRRREHFNGLQFAPMDGATPCILLVRWVMGDCFDGVGLVME